MFDRDPQSYDNLSQPDGRQYSDVPEDAVVGPGEDTAESPDDSDVEAAAITAPPGWETENDAQPAAVDNPIGSVALRPVVAANEPGDQRSPENADDPGLADEAVEPGPPADRQDPPDKPPVGPESNEAGDDEPLLPSTENDVKWEAWHGGTVDVTTNPERPDAEIVKIYHAGDATERPITVQTPGGVSVNIGGRDIIQVYGRTAEGIVDTSKPAYITQDVDDLPPGYTASVDGEPVQTKAEFIEKVKAMADEKVEIVIDPDLEQISEPAIGKSDPTSGPLRMLSNLLAEFRSSGNDGDYIMVRGDIPAGNRYETIEHYELFFGRPTNIVTPAGALIKGHSYDIVDIMHRGPDGGYERLHRMRLPALGEQPRYMTL